MTSPAALFIQLTRPNTHGPARLHFPRFLIYAVAADSMSSSAIRSGSASAAPQYTAAPEPGKILIGIRGRLEIRRG